jgi:non-ribosomal peptide synthetase component F
MAANNTVVSAPATMTALVLTSASTVPSAVLTSHSPDLSSLPSLPLFLKAKKHATVEPNKVAVVDRAKAQSFTYRQLLADAAATAKWLLEELRTADLSERRIAFLVPNGYDYVVVQWAVWAAGGVCVPLCTLPVGFIKGVSVAHS